MSYVPSRPAAEVLLLTADDELLAEVTLLAETVGATVHRLLPTVDADDPAVDRLRASASLTLLDARAAWPEALERDGLLLVGDEHTPGDLASGASEVIRLPAARGRLLDLFAAAVNPPIGVVVGVISTAGGLGASTLAVAMAARSRRPAVLVDGDPVSAGLEVVLGAEHTAGLRWADLAGLEPPMVATDLPALLPAVGSLRWLSHRLDAPDPPTAAARRAVLHVARAHAAVTVVDLGRGLDLLAVTEADALLLVAAGDIAGLVGLGRYLRRLAKVAPSVGIVLRERPGSGVSRREAAEVAGDGGAEVVATLPAVRGLAAATDRGDLLASLGGRLGRAADTCLAWASEGRSAGRWPR